MFSPPGAESRTIVVDVEEILASVVRWRAKAWCYPVKPEL